jgi:hypothetical protein
MTNDRKWGIEFINPSLGIQSARLMGPGPYYAIPLAFFTSQDERTQYAIALWIPELGVNVRGELATQEHARLVREWLSRDRKVMIQPLYVGPAGLEFTEENQRPYQRRIAVAMEAAIWRHVHTLMLALNQSTGNVGDSWRDAMFYEPQLASFWEVEN